MRHLLLLLLLLALPAFGGEPLRVAVAANFRATLTVINAEYERTGGQRVVLSSASTGVLATQILHGAPFDLFLSADTAAPQRLFKERGAALPPACYAVGRLALAGGELAALAAPDNSVAIANPDTAPYGRAALSVLQRDEFESGAQRKLVRGNNVVQAYQFFASGAVDLALLPRAVAPSDAASVPAQWHGPIEQHLLLLRDSPAMRSYLMWLRSDRVRSLIEDAGYEPCP